MKRIVRQRCGFGCVVCGLAIYDYEHVQPEFHDAKEHDPDCIVLLCPNHHALVTRGLNSKNRILEYARHPAALKRGFVNGFFEVGKGPLVVKFGGIVCQDTPKIISVGNIPLLEFRKPSDEDPYWHMSAIMADFFGNPLLSIQDSQWKAINSRWDIETSGNRIVIRNGARDIGLRLRHDPGNSLVFERAKLSFAGIKVECFEEGLATYTNIDGGVITVQGGKFSSCGGAIGFSIPPQMQGHVEAWKRRIGEFHKIAPQPLEFRNIPFSY